MTTDREKHEAALAKLNAEHEAEKKTLTEDILGEFGFRCVWEYWSHYATVKVYEITSRVCDEANTPMFHKLDAPSWPTDVEDIKDAEVYADGYLKWDGCSEINHGDHHTCDLDGIMKHCMLLKYLWERAHELIERSDFK